MSVVERLTSHITHLCLPFSNFKLIKQVYCHRYDLNLSSTSHELGDALLLGRRSTLFLQEYNTRPSCRCCRCASAATAAAALLPSCCRQAATAVTKLPATTELPLPPLLLPPLRCRHASQSTATAAKVALPPSCCAAAKLAAAPKLPLPPLPPPRCHHRGARHDAAKLLPPLPPMPRLPPAIPARPCWWAR
jgi:hypothetical protein